MRINEDYIDTVGSDELIDDSALSMDVRQNVEWLLAGHHTNIDFYIIDRPIYKVKSTAELKELISICFNKYGNGCSLNWMDVSTIQDMSYIFSYCQYEFDVSKWNVSSVLDMTGMFYKSVFNNDISNWNVSKVKTMENMFYGSEFNKDISRWNVSKVTDMNGMFSNSSFNKDISKWNVSNVWNMTGMFCNSKFDKDISSWNIKENAGIKYMFLQCPIRDEFKPKRLQILNHDD